LSFKKILFEITFKGGGGGKQKMIYLFKQWDYKIY